MFYNITCKYILVDSKIVALAVVEEHNQEKSLIQLILCGINLTM